MRWIAAAGGEWRLKYERAIREIEFTKKRLQQELDDKLEVEQQNKRQLERRVSGGWRRGTGTQAPGVGTSDGFLSREGTADASGLQFRQDPEARSQLRTSGVLRVVRKMG